MYKRSDVWQFFAPLKDGKRAKCELCKNTYSMNGGVTNLKKHLAHKHPTIDLHTGLLITVK